MSKRKVQFFVIFITLELLCGFLILAACKPKVSLVGESKAVDSDAPYWFVSDGFNAAQVHRVIDETHENVCYVAVGPTGVAIDCLSLEPDR